jgi:hypothetical protein
VVPGRRCFLQNEDNPKPPTLTDDQIVTSKVDRRSFLAKVGLGVVIGAAVVIPACGKSDDCDLDPTDACSTDND